MDLRSGLVGPQRLPRPTGNQQQGGRDLEAGNNVEFGKTRKEKDGPERWACGSTKIAKTNRQTAPRREGP